MVVAAVIWVTGSITTLAVMWGIYSNNQMEKMQEKLWDLQEELEELKPNPEEREKIYFEIDARTKEEIKNGQIGTMLL